MALALSGTAVELREVLLATPPSLREVSPKATVPVLITDEQQVFEESLDTAVDTARPAALLCAGEEVLRHSVNS